ncbi:hypothetical protein LTR46_000213 [Exophiala xenobiotica]|nr:hypothetical protein LTR46_000213 [Exophiala xenobiotica]
MSRINPFHALRVFDRHYIRQIHRNRLAVTPHEHTLQLLVLQGVDLLVRHVGRHVDEVARPGFGGELEGCAPSHARPAFDDVDDALEVAVVVGAGFGVGVDLDGARPESLCADAGHVHGRGAAHAGCLRGVGVQVVGRDDADAAGAPGVRWCVGRRRRVEEVCWDDGVCVPVVVVFMAVIMIMIVVVIVVVVRVRLGLRMGVGHLDNPVASVVDGQGPYRLDSS